MSNASYAYDEESVSKEKTNWDMGTSTSSRAFGGDSWSYEYIAHQNQNVHLVQKIKPVSNLPRIPATLKERLAFYRLYFNCYGKVYSTVNLFDFNSLIWDYFFTVSLKLLPTSYIYFFLSSYVPEEHLYIPKMVPFFYGYNFLLFYAAMILIYDQGFYVILLFYYALAGLIFQSPWKNCNTIHEHLITSIGFNFTIECIDIPSLLKLKGESISVKREHHPFMYTAISQDNITSYYIPAPCLQLNLVQKTLASEITHNYTIGMFCIVGLFITTSLFYKQLYKKYIWKILYNFQWVLQIIYVGTAIHLLLISLETRFESFVEDEVDESQGVLNIPNLQADSNMFSEMVHAPPLIHFLTSRSTDQINPASDTATLILSNSMFFFLKVLTHQKMIRYCEHISGLNLRNFSSKLVLVFFFWPTYLSTVPFGDILVILVFIVSFVTEFLTLVICYQTLIEVIMSKWKHSRRRIALTFLILIMIGLPDIIFRYTLPFTSAVVLWSSAFIEITIIVIFYPVSRLIDDITFHYGSPPSQITELIIKSTPFTYAILFYKYYSQIIHVCQKYIHLTISCELIFKELGFYHGFITVTIIIVIGAIYKIITSIFIKRQDWRVLFTPVPEWGPLDHIQRQLRKHYDSREYISSRASRYLSRYLMTRASERSYQLDLVYERQGVRSTLLQDSVKIANEQEERKKEKLE